MTEIFPDLETYVGRWNKKVYCSKLANSRVTSYESRYNCGCCDDSPLEIWPYIETEHGRVYSSPARFFVGKRNPSYGYEDDEDDEPYVYPYPDWRQRLAKHGISEEVIHQLNQVFYGVEPRKPFGQILTEAYDSKTEPLEQEE